LGISGFLLGRFFFWVASGDGMFRDILEGKRQGADPGYKNPSWFEAKLYWYSNDAFEIVRPDINSGAYFTRLHMVEALKLVMD